MNDDKNIPSRPIDRTYRAAAFYFDPSALFRAILKTISYTAYVKIAFFPSYSSLELTDFKVTCFYTERKVLLK